MKCIQEIQERPLLPPQQFYVINKQLTIYSNFYRAELSWNIQKVIYIQILTVTAVPIGFFYKYCTKKSTSIKYVSKYNFYKMTQAYAHTYVNYLRRDGCLPSRGAAGNSRRLFFIVSLFSPSLRQNVHLLTYHDIPPSLIPPSVAVHGSLLFTDKNQWRIFAHLRTRGTSA